MQGAQPIPVYRPTELTDGPEFQPYLVESPANIFYQQVKASRATLERMQFQWRSVSDNLLLSPTMRLRFLLKITCPMVWTQVMAAIPLQGVGFAVADNANDVTYVDANLPNTVKKIDPAGIIYADGDAFTNCCSSINLNFNGTSLSLNRTNMFWRDFQRCQLSSEDSARVYKSAGGAYDHFDQTACSVIGGTGNVRVGTTFDSAVGCTMDSGVQERSKALYASLQTGAIDGQLAAGKGPPGVIPARYVWVSYPVPVAPFNPWRGYAMPSTSPYSACPLAIPHLSAGGIDFLLEDFRKAFIRRIGSSGDAAGAANVLLNNSGEAVGIELVEDNTTLELKYFRLSHTRTLKESYRFNVWQAQTFLGKSATTGTAFNTVAAHGSSEAIVNALKPTGRDPFSSIKTGASMVSYDASNKRWILDFDTINLAQVPSFLLISAPKLSSSYTQGSDQNAGQIRNCVRNLSRNLCIKAMRIVVNSARGAIDIDGTDKTGYVDAERLWEMTLENSGSHYFKKGGFRAWRDFQCAVLLNSSQFAPGLQVSDGVAYPIQIQLSLELENRAVDVHAYQLKAIADHNALGGAKLAHSVMADNILARAQCTAIFTKVVLTTTETSATTNALNYPLDSAERLLNAAGQMR